MTDEQLITHVIQLWMDASKKNDLETILSLMDDGAIFLVSGQSPMTKSQFAENFQKMAQQDVVIDGTSQIQEISVCGELAYSWNNLQVKMTGQGKESMRSGPVLSIFKKTDGKWKLYRDANLLGPAQ